MPLLREQKDGEEPKRKERGYRRRIKRKQCTVKPVQENHKERSVNNDKGRSKRRSIEGKPHYTAIET